MIPTSFRKGIARTSAAVGVFVCSVLPAFAQLNGSLNTSTNNSSNPSALLNPLQATSLTQLLQEILSYVVILGGIALTIMLVYTGFLFVAARGAPEKVSQARSALLWTVVGGILLLGASALATVITSTVSTL
jgi:hypothetical protein